jgi:hypothetical protein
MSAGERGTAYGYAALASLSVALAIRRGGFKRRRAR